MRKDYVLEPFDIKELKNINTRKSNKKCSRRSVIKIVEEFAEMDQDCCKLHIYNTNREAFIECTIIRRSIELAGYNDKIKAVLRGDGLYLVKKDKWEAC